MHGPIGLIDSKLFEEIYHLPPCPDEAFKRQVLKILDAPDLTQSKSRELFEMKEGNDDSLDDFMSRLQFLFPKSFSKIALRNTQQIAVTSFS